MADSMREKSAECLCRWGPVTRRHGQYVDAGDELLELHPNCPDHGHQMGEELRELRKGDR